MGSNIPDRPGSGAQHCASADCLQQPSAINTPKLTLVQPSDPPSTTLSALQKDAFSTLLKIVSAKDGDAILKSFFRPSNPVLQNLDVRQVGEQTFIAQTTLTAKQHFDVATNHTDSLTLAKDFQFIIRKHSDGSIEISDIQGVEATKDIIIGSITIEPKTIILTHNSNAGRDELYIQPKNDSLVGKSGALINDTRETYPKSQGVFEDVAKFYATLTSISELQAESVAYKIALVK